jgi:hypothetical protein
MTTRKQFHTLGDLLTDQPGDRICRFDGRTWAVSHLRGALEPFLGREAYTTAAGNIRFFIGDDTTASIRFEDT